jgi:hypothetical protein
MAGLRIAWVIALAGCGGAAGSPDGGLTDDQACTDVATAHCARLQSCSNGARITRDFGDFSTCVVRERLGCLSALAAPSTGQSAATEEACAAALPSQDCNDLYLARGSSCAVSGALADGAPCAFNGQCQSSYCVHDKNAACGVCGQPPAAGASCANDFCARGQFCDSVTSACAAGAGDGNPCNRMTPCGPGSSCVGATMTTSGTCQPAASQPTAACDPRQRSLPSCDPNQGLSCNTLSLTCTAIAYVDDGQPCGVLADGSTAGCKGGGLCVIATGQTVGTCKAPAPDGAACDLVAGPPCLFPARCAVAGGTAGTCVVPVGAACH